MAVAATARHEYEGPELRHWSWKLPGCSERTNIDCWVTTTSFPLGEADPAAGKGGKHICTPTLLKDRIKQKVWSRY